MWVTICFSVFAATFITLSGADDAGFPHGTVEEDLTFVFYTRKHPEGKYIYSNDISQLNGLFDRTLKTVVLIHGWRDGYGADSNTYVRKAILSKSDVNIIKVCWRPLAFTDYIKAKNSVPDVGRITASFLKKVFQSFNYSFDRTVLVGFSLGAHVAGIIGKNLPGKIPYIVGLDPAGPLVNHNDLSYSLNKADARYVTAIHTNAGVLGMTEAVGHSDFYPNGGRKQPGCGLDLIGACAHNRAWALFAESVTNNRFDAKKCSSYQDFQNNRCSDEIGRMGGFVLDTKLQGTFYLDTNDASPFGRGR